MTEDRSVRIARMFRSGLSLDVISETGLTCGWTRGDARRVVEANGWELSWDGRVVFPEIDDRPKVGEIEQMLNVGLDHEVPAVVVKAKRAMAAIDALRQSLVDQEEKDYAESLNRREKYVTRWPSKIVHGTFEGYQQHRQQGSAFCGPCAAAGEAQNGWPRDYTGEGLPGAPEPLQGAGEAS